MTRSRLSLILVVLLLSGVVVAVGAGTALGQAPANTLDSIAVKVAACDGFDGRIDAVVTTDGTHAFLENNTSGGSYNVGSLGAGTHTKDTQYFAPVGSPPNTIVTVTVTLGSASGLDDYGSETISFNCTTGELAPGSTTTTTTTTIPFPDRVAVGQVCDDPGPLIRVFQNTGVSVYFRVTIEGTVAEFMLLDGGNREFPMATGDTYRVEYRFDEGDDFQLETEAEFLCAVDTTTTTTTTTVPDTSTTAAPTTTTSLAVAPTSITVAPTSVVSTTVAATTTIAEVETDIVDGDSLALPMLVLAAIGLLTLSVVAVRARRFNR